MTHYSACNNDIATFKSKAFMLFYPFHFCPIFKWPLYTHHLTELHNQEEGDALTALPQTLKDVGMFKAPGGRKRNDR